MVGLGLEPEQRVLLCLLDTVDFPVAFLGCIKAGIVPIAANTLLTTADYEYMLRDSRAHALIVSAPLLAVFAPLLGRMPNLKQVVVSGASEVQAAAHISLSRLLANASAGFAPAETTCDDTVLLVVFVRLDRTAQRNGARALESDRHRRIVCMADSRHPRGGRRVLGGETVLRLRSGQRAVRFRCRSAPPPC